MHGNTTNDSDTGANYDKGEDHDDIKSNDNDSYNMKNKKIINLKMNVLLFVSQLRIATSCTVKTLIKDSDVFVRQ